MMNDRQDHRSGGSRNHYHRGHRHSRRRSSWDKAEVEGVASQSPRAAKRQRFGSDAPKSPTIHGSSSFRKTHHRSISSASRTAVPGRPPPRSFSPPRSYHDFQPRQPNSQGPTIIEKAVSQLRTYQDSHFEAVKEHIRTWETNGFVNPGCVLPPIADPQLYFLYDKARLQSQKDEVRKRERFIGDRIYAGCLIYVLEQWRFPRRCISLLYDTFISKIYQERLFHKWNVFDFLSHGQGWTRNTRAEAIELYCSIASRDPLYEFSNVTFQKRFAAVLEHALLPVLEYVAEVYEPPPDVSDIKAPSGDGYRYLTHKTSKYSLEADQILQEIVRANKDEKKNKDKTSTENQDGSADESSTQNQDSNASTRADQIWKSVTTFSIPRDENHEFWQRSGLNPKDGNFQNSLRVQVFAYAPSQQEAKSFATMRIIALVELIRTFLKNSTRLLTSNLMKNTTRLVFADMNCDALKAGQQLFTFYQSRDIGGDGLWHSMKILMEELLQRCPADLKPLFEFYLTYPYIRQKQFLEAYQSLIALRNVKRPGLSFLVSRKLEEVDQLMCLYQQIPPESLGMEYVKYRNCLGVP